MEPRQGRKSFVCHIILSPFQGSALLSGLTPGLRPGLLSCRPYGYAIVPAQRVKIAQPVIVQYVAAPNILWYAPYCTIGGATEKGCAQRFFAPAGAH